VSASFLSLCNEETVDQSNPGKIDLVPRRRVEGLRNILKNLKMPP
jgi:hypothetical protein